MKKTYLLAAAISFSFAAFSQVKIGGQLTATGNSASFTAQEGITHKKSPIVGFGAAVSAEIPLAKTLSLRPSLGLLQKGVTTKIKSTDVPGSTGKTEGELTNRLYYAELPVVLAYNIEMGNKKFFVGAGPSLGIGVFGKSKGSYTVTIPGSPVQTEKINVDAFKKEAEDGAGFKRLDMSANLMAGLQWNSGLYINAGYLHGFNNILSKDQDGHYKNQGLQLTVGMFLRK